MLSYHTLRFKRRVVGVQNKNAQHDIFLWLQNYDCEMTPPPPLEMCSPFIGVPSSFQPFLKTLVAVTEMLTNHKKHYISNQ